MRRVFLAGGVGVASRRSPQETPRDPESYDPAAHLRRNARLLHGFAVPPDVQPPFELLSLQPEQTRRRTLLKR